MELWHKFVIRFLPRESWALHDAVSSTFVVQEIVTRLEHVSIREVANLDGDSPDLTLHRTTVPLNEYLSMAFRRRFTETTYYGLQMYDGRFTQGLKRHRRMRVLNITESDQTEFEFMLESGYVAYGKEVSLSARDQRILYGAVERLLERFPAQGKITGDNADLYWRQQFLKTTPINDAGVFTDDI